MRQNTSTRIQHKVKSQSKIRKTCLQNSNELPAKTQVARLKSLHAALKLKSTTKLNSNKILHEVHSITTKVIVPVGLPSKHFLLLS